METVHGVPETNPYGWRTRVSAGGARRPLRVEPPSTRTMRILDNLLTTFRPRVASFLGVPCAFCVVTTVLLVHLSE